MSDDFNLDNEGSGFALEAGQDLDSLLNAAKSGEDKEDNIATDWLFQEGGTPPEDKVEEPVQIVTPEPIAQETEAIETNYEVEDVKPQEEVFVPEPVPPVEEPIAEEEPVVEEPFVQFNEEPEVVTPAPRTNSNDQLSQVSQVVRILNAYRDLNSEEQDAVSQFVSNGEIIKDESVFIVAVLNADPTLGKAMTALKEAKDLEAVDRAFYVIELSENLIYYLGGLISVFTEEEISRKQPRGQYAKALVRSIEKLDAKDMTYVHATASVLEAVLPPTN